MSFKNIKLFVLGLFCGFLILIFLVYFLKFSVFKNIVEGSSFFGVTSFSKIVEIKKDLTESWGEPDMTLGDACNVECLQQKLKPGQVAILGSEGHSSVVTGTYTDPYVDVYDGDVWILPIK